MTNRCRNHVRRMYGATGVALAAFLVSACGDDDGANDQVEIPTPTPAPTSTSTPASYDVTACIEQTIPGTDTTVAGLIIPDTLSLDLGTPSGFPNGRTLTDPVIDVILAAIFLDLSVHGATTLAEVPVNPPGNDVAFRDQFPYLGAVQGNPPLEDGTASGFTFRTDDPSAYVRVDRVGAPAVATALIPSGQPKLDYNDASPADDVAGEFVPELTDTLTALTNALADDLTGLGLTPCAEPV